jgi:excisionase family DNA binding protein
MNTIFNDVRAQVALSTFSNTGLVSIREAAARTNTGEETLRRAIRAGKIPAYGTRGRLRVRITDVMPQYVPERIAARGAQ